MPKSATRATPQPEPASQQPGIPLRDDPYAPVIYATELAGGGQQGENFNLTFSVMLYDHSQGNTMAYRKTNLRLVMPIGSVAAATHFLEQLLKAHGEAASTEERVLQ